MGMSEDDRIRRKNFARNEAEVRYKLYREKLMSHGDIIAIAEAAIRKDFNDKVMYEVLKMAVGHSRDSVSLESNQV